MVVAQLQATLKKFSVWPTRLSNKELNITLLVRDECVRTNIVHALAVVVAIKLGIILLIYFAFLVYFRISPFNVRHKNKLEIKVYKLHLV